MPAIEESWQAIAATLGYRDEQSMLRSLYTEEEFSINEIAKILGFSSFNVRRRLIEHQIPLRSRGGPNKLGKRSLLNVSDEELNTSSYEEIAAKYHVHVSTVYAERRLRRPCNSVQ